MTTITPLDQHSVDVVKHLVGSSLRGEVLIIYKHLIDGSRYVDEETGVAYTVINPDSWEQIVGGTYNLFVVLSEMTDEQKKKIFSLSPKAPAFFRTGTY